MLLWLSPAPEILLGNLRHKFLATLVDSQVVWLQPVENLISTIRFIASQKVPKGTVNFQGHIFPFAWIRRRLTLQTTPKKFTCLFKMKDRDFKTNHVEYMLVIVMAPWLSSGCVC